LAVRASSSLADSRSWTISCLVSFGWLASTVYGKSGLGITFVHESLFNKVLRTALLSGFVEPGILPRS
jgi:hypothetical protein